MKKLSTLILSVCMATTMMAQMHGSLTFVGASQAKVLTTNIVNNSDTVSFAMTSANAASITLPDMNNNTMNIASFTIENVNFNMSENHVIEIPNQKFTSKVTVNGKEKQITGSDISGNYNMADNALTLKAVFKYGAMPFELTYNIKAYYVKSVTKPITVTVAHQLTYNNDAVTYNVRKYIDGDQQKLDVQIASFTLDNTVMGNLRLGSYTIKGLTYDEVSGGFYRDYKDDGLSMHFTAEKDGTTTMNADYDFNPAKDNNILVKYDGNNISDIINTFQVGAMPFCITTAFKQQESGINAVKNYGIRPDGIMYDLNGRRVTDSYNGVVIVNGKKYLKY